jgi:hypothetical protein
MGFVNEWDRDGEVGVVGGLDADSGSVAPYETAISANKITWRWGKEPTGCVNIQTLKGGTTFITTSHKTNEVCHEANILLDLFSFLLAASDNKLLVSQYAMGR